MRLSHHLRTCLLAAPLLLAACGEGTYHSGRESVEFSPLGDQSLSIPAHDDPGPSIPDDQRAQLTAVIDGFRTNASEVLSRPDVQQRISRIESVFMAGGHAFELIAIYQAQVADEGISSPAAPRLAWILLQLGQEKQARMWIDHLLIAYPERASSWYLDAIYHLPGLRDGGQQAARAVNSFRRSQRDEASLSAFGQPQVQLVARQVADVEARLSDADIAAASDAVDDLLSTPAEQLPTPPALRLQVAPREASDAPKPDALSAAAPTSDQPSVSQGPAPSDDHHAAPPDPALRDAVSDTPAPAEASGTRQEPPRDTPTPLEIVVARGSIALSNNNTAEAIALFQRALDRDPDNIAARFGLARAAWANESTRKRSIATVNELAQRPDLTPRMAYELGLFAFSKLQDPDLARSLWLDVSQADPTLAERVGLQRLLERVSP